VLTAPALADCVDDQAGSDEDPDDAYQQEGRADDREGDPEDDEDDAPDAEEGE
jgi:hypothetical protein